MLLVPQGGKRKRHADKRVEIVTLPARVADKVDLQCPSCSQKFRVQLQR